MFSFQGRDLDRIAQSDPAWTNKLKSSGVKQNQRTDFICLFYGEKERKIKKCHPTREIVMTQRPRTGANFLKKVVRDVNGSQPLAEGKITAPRVGRRSWPDAIEAVSAVNHPGHKPWCRFSAFTIGPPSARRTARPPDALVAALDITPGHGVPFYSPTAELIGVTFAPALSLSKWSLHTCIIRRRSGRYCAKL